jgi:tRNA modification GTPase
VIQVHSKADLGGPVPSGLLAVSSITGEGLGELMQQIRDSARSILPPEGELALNRRQAGQLEEAARALAEAEAQQDIVLFAESLRAGRTAFDRLTGRAGVEDVLDALFSRFCLGK